MVPSSATTVVANGEHFTSGGFFLGETVRLGNFEFIADYFDSLSLSPRRDDAGATFMGSTHSRASTLWWAMIEDSAEGRGALASPLLEGEAWGLRLLPSQPHHGWRTL
jgi:hypothetical protein